MHEGSTQRWQVSISEESTLRLGSENIAILKSCGGFFLKRM
jgi:hypothetical protein